MSSAWSRLTLTSVTDVTPTRTVSIWRRRQMAASERIRLRDFHWRPISMCHGLLACSIILPRDRERERERERERVTSIYSCLSVCLWLFVKGITAENVHIVLSCTNYKASCFKLLVLCVLIFFSEHWHMNSVKNSCWNKIIEKKETEKTNKNLKKN